MNDGQRDRWVYLAYSAADELLYVGVTVDPVSRLRTHRRSAAWWAEAVRIRWQGPYERREGFNREFWLIGLAPIYNRANNPRRGWRIAPGGKHIYSPSLDEFKAAA